MGQHYGQLCSRVLDSIERDGFVRTLSRFGQIYDNGREDGFIDWFREWFRDKGTLWMLITQEMDQTMLMDSKLTDIFWTHAVDQTVQIQNKIMLKNNNDKTPYELWKERPTNVKHFRVYGSKCYIKREDGRMGNFDSRLDKEVFVGYSSTRKAYKCYNMKLNKFVESINVTIDEIGGRELKEEENESMEQLYEEEVKGEDEEDQKKVEEQVQKVPPKTPRKRI
jgi:hypothetical protein